MFNNAFKFNLVRYISALTTLRIAWADIPVYPAGDGVILCTRDSGTGNSDVKYFLPPRLLTLPRQSNTRRPGGSCRCRSRPRFFDTAPRCHGNALSPDQIGTPSLFGSTIFTPYGTRGMSRVAPRLSSLEPNRCNFPDLVGLLFLPLSCSRVTQFLPLLCSPSSTKSFSLLLDAFWPHRNPQVKRLVTPPYGWILSPVLVIQVKRPSLRLPCRTAHHHCKH